MKIKRALNPLLLIIAIIIGWVLFKQFDFKNLTFKHTGLAIVYMVVLVTSIYLLIRNYKKEPKK
jgi:hypothetical protein